MMNQPEIKSNEHCFFTGKTQSGKTFCATVYLAGFKNVIVLDTKGLFSFDSIVKDVPLFTQLEDLMKFGEGKAIYRPRFEELNEEYYERFFKWIYERMNTICYVDELMQICKNASDIPEYAKGILTRGMERNTAMWSATQRPKTIPLPFMSEATHFFIFRLQLDVDKKRVQEIIPSEEIMQSIPLHKFWYYNHNLDKPVFAELKEKNKGGEKDEVRN